MLDARHEKVDGDVTALGHAKTWVTLRGASLQVSAVLAGKPSQIVFSWRYLR
jgi:hypothetical protein